MAVEGPIAGSTSASDLAHLPKLHAPPVPGDDHGHDLHVVADHEGRGVGDAMVESEYATDGKGRKRSASPSDASNVCIIWLYLYMPDLPYHRVLD